MCNRNLVPHKKQSYHHIYSRHVHLNFLKIEIKKELILYFKYLHAQPSVPVKRPGVGIDNMSFIFGIAIYEIRNNNFNFQQNISEIKFLVYSDTFIKRTTRTSPFPCVSSTMILQMGNFIFRFVFLVEFSWKVIS